MTILYLIAHRVRGEPAFDVAERQLCTECAPACWGCTECDQLGYWWIIPTSGHRAYPWWFTELISTLQLAFDEQFIIRGQPGLEYTGEAYIPDMPIGLPDHYASTPSTSRPALSTMLGIAKPAAAPAKITRRI